MQHIGKYEVKDKLGVGGFGQVFRALDPTMGRMVAIKLLTAANDPDTLKRFRNEAAAAGKLRHKNIVTVYEFGEQDGVPYIVMELMDGEDLHRVISKRRQLTLLERVRIMMETAEGLHHAHANGIVHRDVKPANVMLLNDGSVKIMDFGIALVTQDTGSRLTPQGSMLGTFRYMAPEQFFGMPSDQISDIFSYGIIFYELMGGAHPFYAQEPAAVMRNITNREPDPLRRLVPECPEALEAIATRLLSKDRDQRYQSLDDVHYDLAAILLELEAERAKEILAEARQLIAADDLTGAQVLVRKVLDVNPANREARDLRETLQQQIQRKSVRPRVESLVKTGQEDMAAGRHSEAIQSFESALKLDRSNPAIWEQMEQARAQMELSQAKAKCRAEARAAFVRKDFPAARKAALELQRLDSSNPEASQLLKGIQDAADRMEREQRVQDAINKAENLAAISAYDEAQAALEALGIDVAEPKVRELLESLRIKKIEAAQRQRLKSGLATASDLLGHHRFEQAVELLEKLWSEFPSEGEVEQLYRYGQRELENDRRSKAIEAMVRNIEALVADQNFAAALPQLEDGLRRYPDDALLTSLKTRALREKSQWERQQGVQAALRRCQELEAQERFAEAIQAAETAAAKYGPEPAIQALESRLRQALDRQQRTDAVRKAVADANRQLKQGLPENAIPPLQDALARYPGDGELTALMARAEKERQRVIQTLLSEISERVQARDFDRALSMVEQGLARFTGESGLLNQLESVKTARTAWQRQQAIDNALGEAARLAGEKRFEEAVNLLTRSRKLDDPRIDAAISRTQADWDSNKRREAINKAGADARALLKNKQPRDAVKLLKETSTRYRGERELEDLLSRAQADLEEQERVAIIERVTSETRALVAADDYDKALQAVKAGLQKLPRDETLLRLDESIRSQQATWNHQQAVREVERQGALLAQQGKLAEARQLVAKAISRFEGETALLELQARLDREWEQRKRNEAVRAAAAEATALIDAGRLDDAATYLTDAAKRLPGESVFDSLRKRIETEQQSIRQREQLVRDGKALIASGRPEEAARQLKDALSRYPGDAAISAALEQADTELRAKQRADAVQKAVKDAKALASQRDFDRALALLDQNLKAWPGEAKLLDTRNSIAASKAAWEREQSLKMRIAEVEGLLRDKKIAQGLKAVEAAHHDFPDSAVLVELQQRLRFRDAVQRIAAFLDNHRPDDAQPILKQLQVDYPGDPELEVLAARLENERQAQKRIAAVEKVSKDSRARIASRDFEGALSALDAALAQFPKDPTLTAVRQEATAAKNAWQLDEQRRQDRERDLTELRRLAGAAQLATRPADTDDLLQAARQITNKYAKDAAVQAVGTPLVELLSGLQSANRELSNHNFAAVAAICAKFLAADPRHPGFLAFKSEAADRQRRQEVQDLLQRAAAAPDLEDRVRLLTQGSRQYPGDAEVQQEFQAAKTKFDLVISIRTKADASEKAGQWDEAVGQWTSLSAIEKNYPGLEGHLARVRSKREEARAAAVAQRVRQIDEQIQVPDLVAADKLLSQALLAFPDAPPLVDASQRLEKIKQTKARARELLAQGQVKCEQGDYEAGHALLRQAFELDQADAAFRKLVLNAFLRFARSALKTDWRIADYLLRDAAALDSGFKPPEDLTRAIAEQKQNADVSALLAKAEEKRHTGEFKMALGEVEQGLAAYPSDPRLKRQREAIGTDLREWRSKLLEEVQRVREVGESANTAVEIDPLLVTARAIATQSKSDSEVLKAAEAAVLELTERRKQLKSAALWSGFSARRKQLGYVGAAAVLGAAGYFGIRTFLTPPVPPTLTPLSVTTSPAGATVDIDGKSCTAPCELRLKPGSYSAAARLDGYKAVTQSLTIGASANQPLSLALSPLPLSVLVSTNFASGQVTLDGRNVGSLKDGQLALEGLPFGGHELAVSGPEGRAHVRFDAARAQMPVVSGSVTAQNSDAIAIGNLGRTAKLSSAQGNEPVTVDGKASGTISSSGLELADLREGNRELKIGTRSLVMSVRPEPSLTLVVTSERNVGSLIVDAGQEDGVIVAVNGRTVGQTRHGVLRIPLDVVDTPYSVHVEKKGFRIQPADLTARIRKGEETKVAFRVESAAPQLSKLIITGAGPGTRVLVDGSGVGEIAGNGSLTTGVKPGDHDVELSRDGYTPKRFRKNFTANGEVSISRPETDLTPLPPDPRQVDEQDWERIRTSKNASDFDDYVRRHPNGAHVNDARGKLTQITQQSQADAARQAEQTAWDALDKSNKAALQDFLSRFGNGAHGQQARSALSAIEKQEADALAAAQLLREKKLKEKEGERPQTNNAAADQQAIVRALGAFDSAYNRMDLGAMESVWTTMPKSTATAYQNQFKFAKELVFHLQPLEAATVSGDSAAVDCTRSLTVTPKSGPRPPGINERVKVTLGRAGNGWVIRSIGR